MLMNEAVKCRLCIIGYNVTVVALLSVTGERYEETKAFEAHANWSAVNWFSQEGQVAAEKSWKPFGHE